MYNNQSEGTYTILRKTFHCAISRLFPLFHKLETTKVPFFSIYVVSLLWRHDPVIKAQCYVLPVVGLQYHFLPSNDYNKWKRIQKGCSMHLKNNFRLVWVRTLLQRATLSPRLFLAQVMQYSSEWEDHIGPPDVNPPTWWPSKPSMPALCTSPPLSDMLPSLTPFPLFYVPTPENKSKNKN